MKLTENIRKLFHRKHNTPLPQQGGVGGGSPLRIEGIADAPLTPEPDEAELAAQAVLEMSLPPAPFRRGGVKSFFRSKANNIHHKDKAAEKGNNTPPSQGGAGGVSAYYHALADRIREGRETQRQHVTRFLAYCEQELNKPHLPASGPGSLVLLETELYKRMDTVDREQGELKRRWQHCLADVTVRLMKAEGGLEGISHSSFLI